MQAATQQLIANKIADQTLNSGSFIPQFNLPNALGLQIEIIGLLKNGPIIVIFYRGSWCLYCNLE
jgi:peroxiredoxin